MKKRYLLFAGIDCYPCGGMDDLEGDYNSIVQAVEVYLEGHRKIIERIPCSYLYDWGHVYDTKLGEVVWDSTDQK